jgi:DNA repair protein RadC
MSSDTSLTLRELPRTERPRERLKDHGARALSSSERLAILIGSGTPGHSALTLAHEVLARSAGSLRRVATQPIATLTEVHGLGEARAIAIHAALELGRRSAAEERPDSIPLRGPWDVFAIYSARLDDCPVEEFHVAILDAQHRIDRDVLVTRGLLNTALVHPREVFREAIAERAAAIILVHNHPSGDPTPSPDDHIITAQLVEAGRLLGIPVQDHIIVGRGRYVSFSEAGILG